MPCTLQPWEIEYEEKRANRERFGLDMNDHRVATEVACRACRLLEKHGLLKNEETFLLAWWKEHKRQDAKRKARKVK